MPEIQNITSLPSMIEVAIVDDDEVLRSKVKRILNHTENIRCRLDVGNLGSFFEHMSIDLKIDILLLDLQLGDKNSLDYLGSLKRLLPDKTKILICTGYEDPSFLLRGMRDGADGYILKGAQPKKLLEVIQTTYEGGVYVEPNVVGQALPLFRLMVMPIQDKTAEWARILSEHGLSERESQVAIGLKQGKSYKEIAANNNLSLNTVRHYVKVLYHKMDVKNKFHLFQRMKDMF